VKRLLVAAAVLALGGARVAATFADRSPNVGRPLAALGRGAVILLAGGFFLFPVYWVITMAFKPEFEWESIGGKVFWVPQHWTLDNFRIVFGHPPTSEFTDVTTSQSALPFLKNSLIEAGGGSALARVVGTFAAYGVARFRAGGRRFPLAVLLIRALPPLVFLIPLFFLLYYVGLFDTYLGLILVYGAVTFPFVVWLMRSFFQDVPREISEAAVVDGCSQWGAFFKAVLPLVLPGLAATTFFVFTLNWSDLVIGLVLTQQHATTANVFMQEYATKAGNLYGQQAALQVLLILPPLVLGIAIRRYLVRGLTFGALR
jgi:multiple sugar transport system permease protein